MRQRLHGLNRLDRDSRQWSNGRRRRFNAGRVDPVVGIARPSPVSDDSAVAAADAASTAVEPAGDAPTAASDGPPADRGEAGRGLEGSGLHPLRHGGLEGVHVQLPRRAALVRNVGRVPGGHEPLHIRGTGDHGLRLANLLFCLVPLLHKLPCFCSEIAVQTVQIVYETVKSVVFLFFFLFA